MASEWKSSLKEINGVNLDNYFPHQRSYNSVVFIHKKYLDQPKHPQEKKEKVKVKQKKEKKNKYDKSQQFNSDHVTDISKDKTYKINNINNDPVLEQTIRFAKNIVPLVIPANEDKLPVFYTIKSTKKHRKKTKCPQELSLEHHGVTYERGAAKKVIETYRKVKKESLCVRESVSRTSSNTLDDLNINQSLCCTFSELSERKYKKEKSQIIKQNEGQKCIVSESFEALATENAGDMGIKIHLMNDKDKNFLSDSIKIPVLNAVRDCIAELNDNNLNTEITTVQRIIKCNTQKLDAILDKLTCIEKRLNAQVLQNHVLPKAQVTTVKPSKLETLGEDLIEIKENYSSEEELHQEILEKRSTSVVLELAPEDKSEKNAEDLREVTGPLKASSSFGIKPSRPNRVPARYCWTDAARN